MIALALEMIRARLAHAVTIFLLSMVAIGAAVAGPTYVDSAQRSITAAAVASAAGPDTTVVALDAVHVRPNPYVARSEERVAASQARQFDKLATSTARVPGFATTFAASFEVAVATSLHDMELREPLQSLQFRDEACQHVEIVAGRCAAGPGEVVVADATAQRQLLTVGSPVLIQAKTYIETINGQVLVALGQPTTLSVVGIYRPRDAADLYWGVSGFRGGNRDEPLLASRSTLAHVDHPDEEQSVILYPLPGTLTADRLDSIGSDVASTTARMRQANITALTSLPALLDRIRADRDKAAVIPTVAAIPLILLCCLVVFLAAASTAQARRVELGMLALRGAGSADRWWLGSAEVVLPVLAGGVVGYAFGQAAVWGFVRLTLTGPWPATFSTVGLPQALVAMGAALAAGMLALRRDLAAPAIDLLRRVPRRASTWATRLLPTVAVVVAVAAVVQLRSADELAGISLLAPAVVILAVALAGSAGFEPLMRWWGRRNIRHGRPGLALGALHLGRRGGGSRLLVLLAVAIGLVAFAAIGSDIGTRGRTEQVEVSLGAARVVSVQPTTARALLHAVRTVDPDGSFAMAVMPMRSGSRISVLSVDTTRLAAVSRWPALAALAPAQAAAAVRPKVGDSVVVRGTGVAVTLGTTVSDTLLGSDGASLDERRLRALNLTTLTAVLAPLDGSPLLRVRFTGLREGTHDYVRAVSCEEGCRLARLELLSEVPGATSVTVTSVRQQGPAASLAGPAELAAWVDRRSGLPGPDQGALRIVAGDFGTPRWYGPADVPPSLLPAVASADTLGFVLPGGQLGVGIGARTTVLPRVGDRGALVDLELLARMAEPGPTQIGEVWLSPAAPSDVIDRLQALGLQPYRDRVLADEMRISEQRPNAVGLRFLLAMGILCLWLGVGGLVVTAGVERRQRSEELRALRAQGLSRGSVARAGRVSYLILALAASVIGAVAALIAWLAVGDRMPLIDILVSGLFIPRWPGAPALLLWGGSAVVLALTAVVLTVALSRAARTRIATSHRGSKR